jgi:hypothetical protein
MTEQVRPAAVISGGLAIKDDRTPPGPFEAARPSRRRVHDAALGGKDNYRSDRELLGDLVLRAGGAYPAALRAARRCLARMACSALNAGIDQFVDLGCGMPIDGFPQVHELAFAACPHARVLYVDHDPVVAVHAAARMVDRGRVFFCRADLRDTASVLDEARRRLDLARPVAILCGGVLGEIGRLDHDLGTGELARVLSRYAGAVGGGSRLGLTHLSGDGLDPRVRPLLDAAGPVPVLPHFLRSAGQIRRLFGGLPLMSPGLVDVSGWPSGRPRGQRRVQILAGAAMVGRR